MAKLGTYLDVKSPDAEADGDRISHQHWWKLHTIISLNENLHTIRDVKGTCADAQILLDFAKEADALTISIDALNSLGDDSHPFARHGARELVISSSHSLCKKVNTLRDAVNRQGMLTGERKDDLARLSKSLDCITYILLGSQANNYGDRITKDSAPLKVVKEWNGHWHTVRHTAKSMKHWAEGMADHDSSEVKPQHADQAAAIGADGMRWQDARKLAEDHVRAHGGVFPSVKLLAEIVGCSRRTIDKAILKSSYLKARKAEAQSKHSGRTVALTDSAIEEVSERQNNQLEALTAEQNAELVREQRQGIVAKRHRR